MILDNKNLKVVCEIVGNILEVKSSSKLIAVLNLEGALSIFATTYNKLLPIAIDNGLQINSFSVFKSSFLAVSYWNSSIISIFYIS